MLRSLVLFAALSVASAYQSGLARAGSVASRCAPCSSAVLQHPSLQVSCLSCVWVANNLRCLMHSRLPCLARRPAVTMNTGYTDISQIGRKKNPNSGRSTALKGYTVGSFAPPGAKSSGTRITDMGTGYGIGNRFGGASRAKGSSANVVDDARSGVTGGVNPAILLLVLAIIPFFTK